MVDIVHENVIHFACMYKRNHETSTMKACIKKKLPGAVDFKLYSQYWPRPFMWSNSFFTLKQRWWIPRPPFKLATVLSCLYLLLLQANFVPFSTSVEVSQFYLKKGYVLFRWWRINTGIWIVDQNIEHMNNDFLWLLCYCHRIYICSYHNWGQTLAH